MPQLWTALIALPTGIVLLFGLWLLVIRYRRSPRAICLAVIALIGMILSLGYRIAFHEWVVNKAILNGGVGPIDRLTFMRLHGLLTTLVNAIFLGLLIAAVTIDRPRAERPDDE